MTNNYLKIVVRKFYRDKLYTLINLAGLSLAVACCLILSIYLHSELTYDQHNVNHERIYRIVNEYTLNGEPEGFARSSPVLAPMMAEEFDEIEGFARLSPHATALISSGDKTFSWDTVYIADASVFDLFTHEVIYGDVDTVLSDDNNIAVSETFAQRYFGNANPVGEIITTEDSPEMVIGLVFADLPENSHVKYDILFSANIRPVVRIPTDLTQRRQRLSGANSYSYILVSEDFDVADFEPMADAFIERHFMPVFRSRPLRIRYWLEPLADIHLRSDITYDLPKGNLVYLYALIAVALFILLVACINYVNLATARSIQQAKQVGMRKILGAEKGSLVIQFLAESIFLALISVLIGVIFVELVTTFAPINELFGRTIELNLSDHPQILLWLVIFGLGIGLITGLYPALYLSSWAPLSVLVSDQSSGSTNSGLRKALVLTQFTVSVAVVACTLLMADQMRFMSNKALGFEKENRITIRMTGWDLIQKTSVIKNELLQHPNILGATTGSTLEGGGGLSLSVLEIENNDGVTEAIGFVKAQIDLDYLKTMAMEVVEGRDFSGNLLTDYGAWIVNETLVDYMGWDEPVGKRINDGQVVGVVQDFHFRSLHTEVEPLALHYFDDVSNLGPRILARMQRFMIVNIAGEDIRETLSYLEGEFNDFDPQHPFDFEFLDKTLDQFYETDQRLMNLISIFAGICIFIACLGLFGLASFTTEQRRKEIGIRKTLGASSAQIIMLLSKSMLSLVSVGALIGCVIAYFAINSWLGNFAYRIDMGLGSFLIAILAALVVAYVTVALQAYKTAQADPVDALRYE